MTVKIEQRKLLNLLEAYFKLAALESGGVDNWEWYGDSLCQYLQEDEMSKTQDDYDFKDMAENYMKFWIEE